MTASRVPAATRWALVLTTAAACVAPLDRRVPTAAFRGTREALAIAARDLRPERGRVQVGFARVPIEVPAGTPQAGYGARGGAASTGSVDALAARAFALSVDDGSPVVWLTADLLLVEEGLAAEVREAVAPVVRAERLLFHATHTHSGPGGIARPLVYRPVFGAPSDAARAAVRDALAAAVRAAIAELAPGRFGVSVVSRPELVENRSVQDGPVDGRVVALVFERGPGGPRGVLVSSAAHGTLVEADELRLSGDYPAALSAALEARGDVAVAGFAAGACGSMAPRSDARGVEGARAYGRALAAPVGPALARARLRSEVTLRVLALPLTLPKRQWRVGASLAVPELWTALAIPGHGTLYGVSVDELAWITVPAEPSGELARRLDDRARREGHQLVLTSFGGGYLGYVLPDDRYDLPEAQRGPLHPYESGPMSFFGPGMGGLLSAASWHLAKALWGDHGTRASSRAQ